MKRIYFLLTFLLLFTQVLRAQVPYLAWQNCFGGPYEDDGAAITYSDLKLFVGFMVAAFSDW
jgi:hypothetical protein